MKRVATKRYSITMLTGTGEKTRGWYYKCLWLQVVCARTGLFTIKDYLCVGGDGRGLVCGCGCVGMCGWVRVGQGGQKHVKSNFLLTSGSVSLASKEE